MRKYIVGLLILILGVLVYGAAERVIKADKILSNAAGSSGELILPTSGTVTVSAGTYEVLVNDLSNLASAAEYNFSVDTSVNIKTSDGTASELRFYDDSDMTYTGFVAPSSLTTNTTFILPDGDGLPGEALTTDGSGNLSWSSASATLPTTTNGDLVVHDGTLNVRLPAGSTNQLLAVGTGSPSLNYVSSLTSIGINADNNSITNIDNNEIKAGAAIDATKIADGSVTSTEFQYIGGLTSDAQTQISARVPNSSYTASGDVLVGTGSGTYSAVSATDQNTNNSIVRRDSTGAAEFTTIKNGLGNIVYDAVSGQIRSISGTLIADHSGTSFNSYWPIVFGNITNNIGGPQTTLRTTTAAAGGTSYTLTMPPANANGALINDGAGNLTWGTAGSGSFNYIENPGWEGNSNDWTASGGTYARTTTTAQIGSGAGAGSWDSNAASQTLTSDAIAIYAGAYGQNGVVSCKFKAASGTATHLLQAWDGTNVLASQTITSDTSGYPRTNVNFVFPSSGNIRARIVSVASNEPAIYIDDCFLGLAEGFNVSQVSQAVPVVKAFRNTSVQTISSASPTKVQLNAESLDLVNGMDIATNYRFTTQSPGEFMVNFAIGFQRRSAERYFAMVYKNGSNVCGSAWQLGTAAATEQIVGSCVITMVAGDYLELYADSEADVDYDVFNLEASTFMHITRFPTSAETAIAANQSGWYVSAAIAGGNPSLGTSDQASYIEITSSAFTLTKDTGSAPVGIACASGTASVVDQTTCSSNESIGITFNIPIAGSYEVCTQFGHYMQNSSSTIDAYFQLAETSASSSAIVTNGSGRSSSLSTGTHQNPIANCSIFNFSSAGQKTIRAMYEQDITGTPSQNSIIADGAAANGQRQIYFTAKPVNSLMQSPILVGSVTSNSTGAERVERISFGGSGFGTNCTASPCTINSQSGSWVSSVTRSTTGSYIINFAAGIFSGRPVCTCTGTVNGSNRAYCGLGAAASTTTVDFYSYSVASPSTLADAELHVICMGPR